MLKNEKNPQPLREVEHQGLRFVIYRTAAEMGRASALSLAAEQVRLADAQGETSLLLMAAPSAFGFYSAYAELAERNSDLQRAIGRTHFFQFDDYPLPGDHPATFRYLLNRIFFAPLQQWVDSSRIHALNVDAADPDAVCRGYTETVLSKGPDLQLKGMGENGHWGFHEPGISLDGDPAYVRVALSEDNARQQVADHPDLFARPEDVPREAFTANVPLFLRTRVLIEDNVPQERKGLAFLAAYANDTVHEILPSSALKRFPNAAVVRVTEAAAREWLEYLDRGCVTRDSLARMAEAFRLDGPDALLAMFGGVLDTMKVEICNP